MPQVTYLTKILAQAIHSWHPPEPYPAGITAKILLETDHQAVSLRGVLFWRYSVHDRYCKWRTAWDYSVYSQWGKWAGWAIDGVWWVCWGWLLAVGWLDEFYVRQTRERPSHDHGQLGSNSIAALAQSHHLTCHLTQPQSPPPYQPVTNHLRQHNLSLG